MESEGWRKGRIKEEGQGKGDMEKGQKGKDNKEDKGWLVEGRIGNFKEGWWIRGMMEKANDGREEEGQRKMDGLEGERKEKGKDGREDEGQRKWGRLEGGKGKRKKRMVVRRMDEERGVANKGKKRETEEEQRV